MTYAVNIYLCIAVPLLVALFLLRGGTRRFTGFILLGMTTCLISAYISAFLEMVNACDSVSTAIYISPTVEELLSMLPLLVYYLMLLPENEELLLAGIGIGIGFATFENCCYLLEGNVQSAGFMLVRGGAAGVMHLASAETFALAMILIRATRIHLISGMAGALSMAVTIHAMYNLLVSSDGLAEIIGFAFPVPTALILYAMYRKYFPEKTAGGSDG